MPDKTLKWLANHPIGVAKERSSGPGAEDSSHIQGHRSERVLRASVQDTAVVHLFTSSYRTSSVLQ